MAQKDTKIKTLNSVTMFAKIAEKSDLPLKDVRQLYKALRLNGMLELKRHGQFQIPTLCKFTVKDTPAKPEREGINPFTKEKTTFKAKPASKKIKVRVLKTKPVKA